MGIEFLELIFLLKSIVNLLFKLPLCFLRDLGKSQEFNDFLKAFNFPNVTMNREKYRARVGGKKPQNIRPLKKMQENQ